MRAPFGDLEPALPREGNVHSADDWHSVLEPVVARYRTNTLKSELERGTHVRSGTWFAEDNPSVTLFALAFAWRGIAYSSKRMTPKYSGW